LNERAVGVMKKATVTPGVIVELVGDDLMVIVPGNSDVVSLSGRPAEVLLDVQGGRDVDPSEPALKTLSDLDIVTSPGMSRRGLIKAGAIGAGAGIVVMAMPSVAMASSGGPISFRIGTVGTSGGQSQGWTITLSPDLSDSNTPTNVPDGTSGTYTTDGGIVVAVTYNDSTDVWESASGQGVGVDEGSAFWKGELVFTIGDIDYVGVAS